MANSFVIGGGSNTSYNTGGNIKSTNIGNQIKNSGTSSILGGSSSQSQLNLQGYLQGAQQALSNPTPSAGGLSVAEQAMIDNINKQYAAMLAQQNQPLPSFDTAANWAKARSQATSTVNPVYTDMLNNYLRDEATATGQQKTAAQMAKDATAEQLAQALEDSATGRTRTTEDTTNALGDITNAANTFQTQEGRSFDAARTALLGNIANSGLTESGLGQGQIANAVTDRNIASKAQTDQFNQETRDTNLNFNRKISDFDTADVRSQKGADSSNKQTDFDLQSYLDTAANNEKDFRYDTEQKRQAAVDQASTQQYNTYVNDQVASLQKGGASASTIAAFLNAYRQ